MDIFKTKVDNKEEVGDNLPETDVSVDPTKVLEEQRTRARIGLGGNLKLTFNDIYNQLPGFHPAYFRADQIEFQLSRGYTPVFNKPGETVGQDLYENSDMGSWVSRPSGATRLYLMKISLELYEEDEQDRHAK